MSHPPDPTNPNATPPPALLAKLDVWMAEHPWHPRVVPFFVYILLLAGLSALPRELLWLHPPLYAFQCGLVVWLLWRYRRLTPELTVRFHWLAVPVGVFVFVAWVLLGWAMAGELGPRWDAMRAGEPIGMIDYGPDKPWFATDEADPTAGEVPHDFRHPDHLGPTLGWVNLILRLLGMSIVVPLFEELFIRSLMLRSLSDRRTTWLGLQQWLCDLPLVGDWLIQTPAGQHASRQPPVFGRAFVQTPLGHLTVFGVCASTFVFMLSHIPRDWPGIWVCGVAYCLCLAATRRLGLGPVVWAHGITNALLWAYTVWTGDWQFL